MLTVANLVVDRPPHRFHYDFVVPTGGALIIKGPSGEGKSTLLDALGGFLTIATGEVTWDGQSLVDLLPEQRPMTTLFQSHNLFDHLTVARNVALALPQLPLSERVAALEALGVSEQQDQYPANLSGGQRQRVGLITALLRPEPVVLLDEPFRELDPATRFQTISWVIEQVTARNKTLLLVSHNADDDALIQSQMTDVRETLVRLNDHASTKTANTAQN
jgi:thiamine transport system ATP-binding protein